MEPFKNLLNPTLVREAAAVLRRQSPDFDSPRFARLATRGLEALELKARALQICAALESTLPADFGQAADLLQAALAPPTPEGVVSPAPGLHEGLRGWVLWPVGEYIARHGQVQPERALQALHALTQRFTAEFAIRPFIVAHPELSFATLRRWVQDPSAHVRRLVSEGSRPRLPWGLRLQSLVADPSPTLPLLLALQDDPSEYVRRSVANHLNDIAKDHPALVAAWVHQHLPDADTTRRSLLRHASRTLIKQGHAETLRAWGLGDGFEGEAKLQLSPKRVAVGDSLGLTLKLRSTAALPQRLVIDYAVHHMKADGRLSPKVFKGWALALGAGETVLLQRSHSLRLVTTRRYHAGRHEVAVHINGNEVARGHFGLQLARPTA